ncbi:MAG: alpha/beta hydrolase [Gammaproteobacteria bacterium]|nr:alpha/beta hydrolase [Gammaproteobacteria bacterium]
MSAARALPSAPVPALASALPTALAAILATLLVAACAREPAATPTPPAADARGAMEATPPMPAPAATVVNDGSPRIVDSPAGRVHIQYRVHGRGEPLVVLIHGWSCDSNYWQAQVADLKQRYTVATVDLAGHGGSGANRSDWSIAAFGADVAAVVETLKAHPKVVLVGHSMGGPVAVEAARRIGPRVVGVIGVDTFQWTGEPPPRAEMERMLAGFEKDFIGTTRSFVDTTFFTKDADPTLRRRIADDMSQAPPAVAIPAMRGLVAWDAVTAMNAAAIPIVALNADLLGPTDEARIRREVPAFRAITVSGLGHFLMMEDPARFNPLLDAQIRALASGTTAPAG